MPSSGSNPDPDLRADLVDLARVAKEPMPVELAVSALCKAYDGPRDPGTLRLDLDRVVASTPSLRSIAMGTAHGRIVSEAEAAEEAEGRGQRSRAALATRRLIAACRDCRAMSPGDARDYALHHLPRHLADAIAETSDRSERHALVDELLLLADDGGFLKAQAKLDPPCRDEATLELAFRSALDHDRPIEAARSLVALAERSAGRETALEAFQAGLPDRALDHLGMLSAAPRLRHALRLALVAQASARDVARRALAIAHEAGGVLREVDDETILDELEMLLPELWELDSSTVLAIAQRATAPRRDDLTVQLAMRLARTDVQKAIGLVLATLTLDTRADTVCDVVETYLAHATDADARDRLPHLVGALKAVHGHGRVADVVGALASLDPGVALDLARSIDDPDARASALADAATTLARAGDSATAREAADEARAVVDGRDQDPSTAAQVRLAVALIALGDETEGRAHLVAGLERVSGPGHHEAKPRSEAARLLLQERRPDLAVEVARASAEPLVRAQVLAAIAPDLRERTSPERIAGLLEEGLREAERIGHPTVRASQELRIAGAMAGAAGRGDRALEIVAASLAPASLDALTLRMGGEVASLTEALAATHGPKHAFEVAASIPADDARELVLAGIAEAWSNTDRLPDGLRLAARLHDPARASAFGRLLVATATEGDMSHVDEVLHAVPDAVALPSTSVLEAACTLVARSASDRALTVLARRSPRSRLVHPPPATTIASDARQLIELGRHEAAATLVWTARGDVRGATSREPGRRSGLGSGTPGDWSAATNLA